MSAAIRSVEIRRLSLPLRVPYRLSYRTFETFEPFLVTVVDESGQRGFGEGHISPGSSAETREGGWAHLLTLLNSLPGQTPAAAFDTAHARTTASPVATSALLGALDMLQQHPLLRIDQTKYLPILTPTSALHADDIAQEVDARLRDGFRTFKVKVGKDVDDDLSRVSHYQSALAGRGMIRIDANRAFSREQGCRFAAALAPEGIELFEQPCDSEDWDANAAVAAASTVPLMLDEPICDVADVERAATIDGVTLCKVKLKRFGCVADLERVLIRIRELGLTPVLGDGLASEPCCWMEACVAATHIDNAGEFNGFLKPRTHLFSEPLGFENGCVVLTPGLPCLNDAIVEAHTIEQKTFGR